jgi:hypothetical protein
MITKKNALHWNDYFELANCNDWSKWWPNNLSIYAMRFFTRMGGEEIYMWIYFECGDTSASTNKGTPLEIF